ncbi:septation protein SepH [Mycobacterium sp.]|uniref:septation protein SepH n=1 Tax=Mycobacterium sp. TaxID=1785 RepID=UPI003BAA3F64
MRELKVVGLDAEGANIICEGGTPPERFTLPADDHLRAALRGGDALQELQEQSPLDDDTTTTSSKETSPQTCTDVSVQQTQLDIDVSSMISPKEIQARIRAGASVEQLAKSSETDIGRIRRFAHPVLLERERAAELATAAHPVLTDGPAELTLLDTVTDALATRGLCTQNLAWDAWRNKDGRWTVQLAWKVGRSDNVAHFRFTPGAHGGIATAIDDAANELIDPDFNRPLRPLAPIAHLDFEEPIKPAPVTPPRDKPASSRRGKPAIPAWEDVLLGVRTSGRG